jgi:aminodeoxyfutalosine deaminase
LSIRDFIAALPKTDLHLHLVGSASVPTVLKLARRYPQAGIPVDADVLARLYTFTDFAHFIDVYHAVDQLVRSPEDVTSLVVGAARDAAASNVRWAELTVTANTHLLAGIDPAALKDALEAGREIAHRELGVRLGFIIDIAAESGLGGADATVGFLRDHAPAGTLAIGLAGLEQAAPRAMFAGHVEQARDLGYRAVIHAGESTGPATIWSALRDLKADRIGHGISAVADPDLLTHLALTGVPLEVCPISNLRTNVVTRSADHPVAALLRAGVTVTLGTDDPGMFDTDLNREYEYVADLVGLGEDELAEIARVGVRSSFAPEDVRRDLIAEINATLAGTYATNAAKLGPQPPLRGRSPRSGLLCERRIGQRRTP